MTKLLYPVMKAKKLPIGTIRTWRGVRMRKEAEGVWKPVPKGRTAPTEVSEKLPQKKYSKNSNEETESEKKLIEKRKFQEIKKDTLLIASKVNPAYAEEWEDKNKIDLVGKTIKNTEELAYLSQVYRNPQYETFRMVFVDKDNKIVAQTAISSRLPGSSTVFFDPNDPRSTILHLAETMDSRNAVGYYLMHNHPSGDVRSSRADLSITKFFMERIPGFREHIIIDETSYSHFNNTLYEIVEKIPSEKIVKYKTGDEQHPAFGKKIYHPDDLVDLEKTFQHQPEKYSVIVGTRADLSVVSLSYIPKNLFSLKKMGVLKTQIKEFALGTGASRVFLTDTVYKEIEHVGVYQELFEEGYLEDALLSEGENKSLKFELIMSGKLPDITKTFGVAATDKPSVVLEKSSKELPTKIIVEIVNPSEKTEKKLRAAIENLQKALKIKPRKAPEPTPYKSLQQLSERARDGVRAGLNRILANIINTWLKKPLKKAAGDVFKLNGKTFINPKTGQALTVKEWQTITKDLDRCFSYLYGESQEMLTKRALALGKLLQSMDPPDRISVSLHQLEDKIEDEISRFKDSSEYQNMLNFSEIHTGELIQDMSSEARKRVAQTIIEAQQGQYDSQKLESKLFDLFSDLNRDWRRIAETETATNFNNGYLLSEAQTRKKGEHIFMRGVSSVTACSHCLEHVNGQVVVLLDSPPADGDEEVVINDQSYVAIWPGKTNQGRNRESWWTASGSQHPHTYSKDTEVLTNNGWKFFSELLIQDLIMALNPTTKEIDFVPWIAKVEHFQKNMINLTGRNFDLLVTPEHKQLYLSRKTGKLLEDSVENIIKKSEFCLPRAVGLWKAEKRSIQVGKLIMSESTYARLWAWFLSDGYITKGKKNWFVAIPQKNNKAIREDLSEISNLITLRGYIYNSDIINMFSEFKKIKSFNKYIPKQVKSLSSQALKDFIDSYSKADGCRREGKAHKSSFSEFRRELILFTTSKKLSDDLGELIVKAGYIPSYFIQKPSGKYLSFPNGKYKTNLNVFIIRVCKSKYRRFSKSMNVGKIKVIDYNDVAYDVELEKWHHLLVRRNGKVAWSGNCRCSWTRYNPDMQEYYDMLDKEMDKQAVFSE